MDTGKKIKGLRKQMNLTQIEFANVLGIAQSYVSSLESNARPLTNEILDKMKTAFPGVDIDFHSGIKEFPSEPNTETYVNLEPVPIVPGFMQRDLSDRMKNADWYFELERVVIDLPSGDYLAFDISGNQLLYDGKLAIFPGDIAVGVLISIETQWEDEKVYAFVTKTNGVMISRGTLEPRRIVATPLNPLFGPVSIQINDINKIYRIIAIQSKRHSL